MNFILRASSLCTALVLFAHSQAMACGSFPAGVGANDLVMEFVANGSGLLKQGTMTSVGTPREGMVVFDPAAAALKICDGTSWKIFSLGSVPTPQYPVATWGTGADGELGDLKTAGRSIPGTLDGGTDFSGYTWSQVSGNVHTCALRASDSRAFCWGPNNYGGLGIGSTTNVSVPTELTSDNGWNETAWKKLSVGYYNTCGIRLSDDRLFCWGYNNQGQLGTGSNTPSTVTTPAALTATNGWDATAWKDVSISQYVTCAIRKSDDKIFCWGNNGYKQLGNGGTPAVSYEPAPLGSTWADETWNSVHVSNNFVCAHHSSGRIYCWGTNNYGQLGIGSATASVNIPTSLTSTGSFNNYIWDEIAVGWQHVCARRATSNQLFCWGENVYGSVGKSGATSYNSPQTLAAPYTTTTWKSISAGQSFTCGIQTDETIRCFGANSQAQLGNGPGSNTSTPQELSATGGWNAETWSSVEGAQYHACAIRKSDSKLVCWGSNSGSVLGRGAASTNETPGLLYLPPTNWSTVSWKSVSAGSNYSCGIRASDNRMLCWGLNTKGMLGDGTTVAKKLPTFLSATGNWDAAQWKSVAAGDTHTCAIRLSDDQIFCWGEGLEGPLGNGTTTGDVLAPAPLTSTGNWDSVEWASVHVGDKHTCALRKSDRVAFCWGYGGYGQIGNASLLSRSAPVPLSTTNGWNNVQWKVLTTGHNHTCGIQASTNLLYCWGNNNKGQLGINSVVRQSEPTPLPAAGGWSTTTWKTVSAGFEHTCAVRLSDERIFCWGANGNGELGTTDPLDQLVPTALQSAGGWDSTGWLTVTAGYQHTCGIRKVDGQIYCWGKNVDGRLGSGSTSTTEIRVPTSLSNSDGWNTKSWSQVLLGKTHTMALPADANDCSMSFSTEFDTNDLAIQFQAESGKTRVGKVSSMSSMLAGLFAFNRTSMKMKVCRNGLWNPVLSTVGASCSSYPAGVANTNRVLEWKADGSNKTYSSHPVARTTPREGSMVYNSSVKSLQVCDGTNWQTLSKIP